MYRSRFSPDALLELLEQRGGRPTKPLSSPDMILDDVTVRTALPTQEPPEPSRRLRRRP